MEEKRLNILIKVNGEETDVMAAAAALKEKTLEQCKKVLPDSIGDWIECVYKMNLPILLIMGASLIMLLFSLAAGMFAKPGTTDFPIVVKNLMPPAFTVLLLVTAVLVFRTKKYIERQRALLERLAGPEGALAERDNAMMELNFSWLFDEIVRSADKQREELMKIDFLKGKKILKYSILNDMEYMAGMSVFYEDDVTGDVKEEILFVSVNRNTRIENETLSYEDGSLIFTRKYSG